MNDETPFPPFVPAKPKGSVAAEIAAANAVEGNRAVEAVVKRRKRRTAAEMVAANSGERTENAFVIYCQIVDMLEYVDKKTRVMMFKMLMDNHT